LLIGSVIALLVAIYLVVHALTQSNSVTASGAHPYVGKALGGPFVTGKPIDGVQCGAMEGQVVHIHQHLDVFIDGKQQTIPANVGIIYDPKGKSSCLYWIHVHDTSGVIHLEAPQQYQAVFGAFLDIWSATPSNRAPFVDHSVLNTILTRKPDVVAVNGKTYGGDIRKIPLGVHTMISLSYGSSSVTQQPYDFTQVDPAH
jgi:hypothetical protein